MRDEYGYDAGPEGFGTEMPPEQGWSLFGYFEREHEARFAVEFWNGNDTNNQYRMHPRRPGAVIWAKRKVAGRTMADSREKDALVIGDEHEVLEEVQKTGRDPNQYDFDFFWDDVYEEVGSLVRERADKINLHSDMGDYWYVEGRNMGWRSQHGYNLFKVHTFEEPDMVIGRDFLDQILPQTDNIFYIYDDDKGHGLLINNFQHDSGPGGEVYECLPVEYMISEGMWWGINLGRDEILPEIQEVLMAEWEFEFLNKELAAFPGREEKMGHGLRAALDIEFPVLYTKFLARYKLTSDDKFRSMDLEPLKKSLEEFYEKYYAMRAQDEWVEFLNQPNVDGVPMVLRDFETELKEFLDNFGFDRSALPSIDVREFEQTYKQEVFKRNRTRSLAEGNQF